MKFIDQLKEKAKQNKKTIVLPETSDMRTIEAAGKVLAEGIANIILVGDKEDIMSRAGDIDLSGASFVDPKNYEKFDEYVDAFVEMRKFLMVNGQLFERLTNVEYKLLEHDKKFDKVFDQLQNEENIKQKIKK